MRLAGCSPRIAKTRRNARLLPPAKLRPMDLRTRTSLFCGALALAIVVSILLRDRARRPQLFFAAFAADIGLWYLAQWLYRWMRADVWSRLTAGLALLC